MLEAGFCVAVHNRSFYPSLNAGFEQAIQAYAVHVLSLTYQKVPRAVLAEVMLPSRLLLFHMLLLR